MWCRVLKQVCTSLLVLPVKYTIQWTATIFSVFYSQTLFNSLMYLCREKTAWSLICWSVVILGTLEVAGQLASIYNRPLIYGQGTSHTTAIWWFIAVAINRLIYAVNQRCFGVYRFHRTCISLRCDQLMALRFALSSDSRAPSDTQLLYCSDCSSMHSA